MSEEPARREAGHAGPVPAHIAVVMDGNGRWAEQRGQRRHAGHRAGAEAARALVTNAIARGIQYLTYFAFSSENFHRPESEVGLLMDLMMEALQREIDAMVKEGARIRFIGDRSRLNPGLRDRMRHAETITADNSGIGINVAVAYGGRWDVLQAARAVASEVADGSLDIEQLDEAAFAQHLALTGVPAPDLFIRTGGEHRISNFLIWDLAYTELYFDPVLWPDFDAEALDRALHWFAGRDRRFGRIAESGV